MYFIVCLYDLFILQPGFAVRTVKSNINNSKDITLAVLSFFKPGEYKCFSQNCELEIKATACIIPWNNTLLLSLSD